MSKRSCLVSVLFFTSIILAVNGFIKRPGLAGESGETLRYTELYSHFYDCDFVDPLNGWICGKAGILYATTDGGITWNEQRSGTDESLFNISFVDKDTGWAVGQKAVIIFTRDGGKTWIPQKSPVKDHLLSLKFTDRNHGVAVGDWGKIIFTEDGGKNWVDVSLEEDIILYCIDFVSKTEGWIAAETGTFFHTMDGGKTWERQDTDQVTAQVDDFSLDEEGNIAVSAGSSFFALSFDEKGNGVAVGMEGIVYYTSDNGNGWQSQRISNESLYNVILKDGKGLAVGHAGGVYETRDAGKTWKKIRIPDLMSQYWLMALAHFEKNRYMVAGARGSMVFINDSHVLKDGQE